VERSDESILIINPGWEQDDLVKFCLDNFKNIHAIFFSKKIKKFRGLSSYKIIDFSKKEKILFWVKKKKIKYIFSDQCDYSLFLQSFLCSKLKIFGPSFINGKLSCDKKKLYQKCIKFNIRIPTTFYFKKIKKKNNKRLSNKKLIVKPKDNRGSIGVSTSNCEVDLYKKIEYAQKNSLTKEAVVQEFIKGKNFIIESNGTDIKMIGEKRMNQSIPYMNDDILFERLNKKSKIHIKLKKNHIKILKLLNFLKGNVSAEYIVDKRKKIWLIELTNRGGGVAISSKIKSILTGVNNYFTIYKNFIKNSKKLRKKYLIKKQKYAYLKYIQFNKSHINTLSYKRNINKMKGYSFHHIWQKFPSKIEKTIDATKRSGILITHGNSKSDVKKFSKKILFNIYPRPVI